MSEPCPIPPPAVASRPVPTTGGAARVLFVDGDRRLLASVFARLEAGGFEPDAAADGRSGLALSQAGGHDVVVIDRALPRGDGLALLRRLRDAGTQVPVLVTLADDGLDARLAAFDAGADDCLAKPFALAELEARLRALSRRRRPLQSQLQVGDLHYDLATGEIRRGDRRLRLYRGCRVLLETLMRESPAIVDRDRLEAALWGDEIPDRDRLRAHVYELRRRIDAAGDAPLLHTVPGRGYRLAVDGRVKNLPGPRAKPL